MADTLADWESRLADTVRSLDMQKAGALLRAVPVRPEWELFLGVVRAAYSEWRERWLRFPHSLVVLYGGVAFFGYDTNRFWPEFTRAVGRDRIPVNQQTELNRAFLLAARKILLPAPDVFGPGAYVSLAVSYIGIPLSLWDEFLEFCEWALWHDEWSTLSEDAWADAVEKQIGGRPRLKDFLLQNREVASVFVRELLEVRSLLSQDKSLPVRELAQASLLRMEYFVEVPETDEFLRPADPDSLSLQRPHLFWDGERNRISVYLPAVPKENLPATWQLGGCSQPASTTPNEMVINSKAFDRWLPLTLQTSTIRESYRLTGLNPWGLFDSDRGVFVSPSRDELPIRHFELIATSPLTNLTRTGFDEDEHPTNERRTLPDASACYVTNLWPTGGAALASWGEESERKTVVFRSRARIEANLYISSGAASGYFKRKDGRLEVERLPLVCVSIPSGYFRKPYSVLNSRVAVSVDHREAAGEWRRLSEDDRREYYSWEWDDPPVKTSPQGRTLRSLKDLGSVDLRPPDQRGSRRLRIVCRELGLDHDYGITVVSQRPRVSSCWKHLPGRLLPWFALCQVETGMRWDELVLAQAVIAPDGRLSYLSLRHYLACGLLSYEGRRWRIAESRAVLRVVSHSSLEMRYCGDPSHLWSTYRCMLDSYGTEPLPEIQVGGMRGEPPFFLMEWRPTDAARLRLYLRRARVRLVANLWEP